MKCNVRPTASSLNDALTIGRWIASEGAPVAAERWVAELLEELNRLDSFPNRHAIAPENEACPGTEIRHRLFGDYRILFTVIGHDVFVLHVRHASRQSATRDELRRKIAEGLAQADRGDLIDGDEVFREILRKLKPKD